ncbi:MAG: hypothetical protein EHM21_11000, partial [Chloroflexi bacterium]
MPDSTYSISFADGMTKNHWGTATWEKTPRMALETFSLQAARNEVTGVQLHIHAMQEFVLTVDKSNWL